MEFGKRELRLFERLSSFKASLTASGHQVKSVLDNDFITLNTMKEEFFL